MLVCELKVYRFSLRSLYTRLYGANVAKLWQFESEGRVCDKAVKLIALNGNFKLTQEILLTRQLHTILDLCQIRTIVDTEGLPF